MTINFNVTGKARKALVQVLSELTFSEPVYAGAPSFAYTVGDYTVDKNGVISCPDTVAPEAATLLIEKLKEQGFTPENEDIAVEDADADSAAEDIDSVVDEAVDSAEDIPADVAAETPDVAPEPEDDKQAEDEAEKPANAPETPDAAASEGEDRLTISIPRTSLADDTLGRLKQIVGNKEVLFKRAVLADALPIIVTEEKISFPWFTRTGIDGEAAAYAQFITALCQMAREQTRILDKPYDGDNDRFAMRIFMVRMGMKGAQFALARKLMMKYLSGNSGWRYGTPPKKEPVQEPVPADAEQDASAENPADVPDNLAGVPITENEITDAPQEEDDE